MEKLIIDWHTRCQHCGHAMSLHLLDWETETGSDCLGFDCQCPGFEPRKESADE